MTGRRPPTARSSIPPFDTVAAKAMLDSSGWRVGADGMRMKNGRPLRFGIACRLRAACGCAMRCLLQEQFQKDRCASRHRSSSTARRRCRAQIRRLRLDAVVTASARIPARAARSRIGRTAGIGPTDRISCATRIRRSTRCSTARRSSFDPAKMKALHVARLSDDHRRCSGNLALRHRRRTTAVNRRINIAPHARRRMVGQPRRLDDPAGQAHRSRPDRTRARRSPERCGDTLVARLVAIADRRPHRDDDQLLRHPTRRRAIRSRTTRRNITPGDSRTLARAVRLRSAAAANSSFAMSASVAHGELGYSFTKHEPVSTRARRGDTADASARRRRARAELFARASSSACCRRRDAAAGSTA